MRTTATLLALSLGLAWSASFGARSGTAGEPVGTAYVGQCDECQGHRDRSKGRHWRRWRRQYREAHQWPQPFSFMARASVREMLAAQVTKGWTRETTLYDYHFDSETNELNRAGRTRLQHLTRERRPERRLIHVQAAEEERDTQDRVAQVRSVACAATGAENCPPISVVYSTPRGARADELIRVRELLIQSTPAPRIRPAGGGGGGAGGAAPSVGAGGPVGR